MKTVSTAATRTSRKISGQKLTIGLDLATARAGTVCRMKPAGYDRSRECGRMRKRCRKSSGPCRVVVSRLLQPPRHSS
jgi:hypothetical protein